MGQGRFVVLKGEPGASAFFMANMDISVYLQALEMEPHNAKALFRRGRAYVMKGALGFECVGASTLGLTLLKLLWLRRLRPRTRRPT